MPRANQGAYLSDKPNSFGIYEVCWTENGRSRRKSTGESDPRRANRVLAEFIIGLDQASVTSRALVSDVISAFLADKLPKVVDAKGMAKTFGHLNAHFGHLAVAEVAPSDVARYLADRAAGLVSYEDEEGRLRAAKRGVLKSKIRGGRKAGASTVRGELSMLSTAIDYCLERRKLEGLTAADKPFIDLPPASDPKDRWLTRDEAQALLAACQPDPSAPLTRVYRYVSMMLYTAARKQTVHTLPWSRIDHVGGVVDFQEPGRARTRKRRGLVPLAKEYLPIVQRAYEERSSNWFCGSAAEPRHLFYDAVKAAGLEGVSPHTLRHTWATWAAQDGVSLEKIAAVLHDTVATVERRYIHHTPGHLRDAVDRPLLVVVEPVPNSASGSA